MPLLSLSSPAHLLLLSLLLLLLTHLLTYLPLRPLDDLLDRLLPPTSPQTSVLLIDIDERSLATLGPWPWSRSLQSRLIDALTQAGVRLQIWDLLWHPEPTPDDPLLTDALRRAHPPPIAALVPVLDPRVPNPPREGHLPPAPPCRPGDPLALGYLAPPPILTAHLSLGHIAPTFDADGKLRRIPAWVCLENRRFPALPLAAALALGVLSPEQAADRRHLTLLRPPDHRTWPTIPADLLLADALSPHQRAQLRGAITLIGSTALGVADRIPTPLDPVTPGLAIHAHLLDQLLAPSSPLPPPLTPLLPPLVALLALLPLLLSPILPSRSSHSPPALPPFSLLLLPSLLVLPLTLLLAHLLAQPVSAAPLLAHLLLLLLLLLNHHRQLRRERHRLLTLLTQLLPEPLSAQIAQSPPDHLHLLHLPNATAIALELRNLDRLLPPHLDPSPSSPHPAHLTLIALLDAIAAHLDTALAPYHPRIHTLGAGRWRILLSDPLPDPTALLTTLAHLLDQLQHHLDRTPTPTPDPPQLALTLTVATGPLLEALIGRGRARTRHLAGPLLETLDALLDLAPDLAAPLLAPRSLLPPHAPLPPGWRPLGTFLLPPAPLPIDLIAYLGSPSPKGDNS
ncbi:MAG: CHASE2 domain-containing protein [Hydrogenophilus sp.]|nr:CHASE2 domain-containing protein [Hydrogenophilus sp.]